jgi:hypothetical protein
VLEKLEVGPQQPFNPVSAKNTTRWSFTGELPKHGFMGSIDLKLYKASTPGKRAPSDDVLWEGTKWLGHLVEPTDEAGDEPTVKRVPSLKTTPYVATIIDLYPAGAVGAKHGHPAWTETTAASVTKTLQTWLGAIAPLADPTYRAAVEWSTGVPARKFGNNELFIYIVPSTSSKLNASAKLQPLIKTVTDAGGCALTFLTTVAPVAKPPVPQTLSTVLCELWPDKINQGKNPETLASELCALIFHEWMHFKLDVHVDVSVIDIHARGNRSLGAANPAATGIGRNDTASVLYGGPTDADVRDMAQALEARGYLFHGLKMA